MLRWDNIVLVGLKPVLKLLIRLFVLSCLTKRPKGRKLFSLLFYFIIFFIWKISLRGAIFIRPFTNIWFCYRNFIKKIVNYLFIIFFRNKEKWFTKIKFCSNLFYLLRTYDRFLLNF